MPVPPMPFEGGPAPSPRLTRILALWLGFGALAVVLVAIPSPLFDLDRFAAPKELALHVTALGALLLLLATPAGPTEFSAAEAALAAYVGWSALSALLATNGWLATRALAVSVSGVVLFRAARRVARGPGAGTLLTLLSLAVVAGAATGLLQAYGLDFNLLAESRAPGGTFGNRNFLAHLMAIGAPLLTLLLLEARGPRRAGLAAAGLGLMVAAVVLTRSRAAWLGLAAALTVVTIGWFLMGRERRRLAAGARMGLLGLALVAGAGSALVLPNSLSWRSDSPYSDTVRDLANYREGSGRGRLIQYRNSLRLAAQHPVFGTGPGNWPVEYPRVTSRGDPSFSWRDPMPTNPWPSSDWVAAVAERGPIGALCLLAALAACALTALRRLRDPDPGAGRRALALLGVLTATVVTGAFDAVLLLAPPTLIAWTAAGLLVPESGAAVRVSARARRWLGAAGVLVLAGAVLRSAGMIAAIRTAGPGWPVERLVRAVRFDPGSYRLHLMVAQRSGCGRGVPHARAAARLFPAHVAPRRRLAACGDGEGR